MTDAGARPVRRRWWKYLLVAGGAGAVLLAGLLWYINTESFQALVRRRLVAEVERITGGRAEVGSFHTTPFRMQVDVRDITVHGREGAGEVPLAHADRVVARLKIISLLGAEVGFHEVVLEHPVVHVAFYSDGTSNVTPPKVPAAPQKTLIEQLFSLSINRLEVRKGELLWGDRTIPLDFAVHDAALQMNYSFLRDRYESRLSLGKVDTKLKDCRPFSWMSSAEFSLGPSFVDVSSLKWSSGRSHLEANGRVSDFRNPHLQGAYLGQIDLGEAAAIARRRELRAGVLDVKGQGNWSADEFAAKGEAALRDFAWQDNQIGFAKASASSEYSLTQQQLKLSKLQGKLLGGSFTGDAQVDNWLAPARHVEQAKADEIAEIRATHPGKPGKKEEKGIQAGLVRLRWRDISTAELAAALNAPAHPLGRLHPAGSGSGTLDGRWKGSPRDAEVEFAADVALPERTAPGQLPISAQAKGTYRGASDTLDLPQFRLSTPNTRIQAAGTLSSVSTLHVSVSTANLDEWQPLIAALHGPDPLPLTLNGSASFNGVVGGTFSAPTLAGTLSVDDFDVTIPAMAGAPQHQVHWDAFSASVQASPHAIALRSASLRHGDTSADFELNANLLHGHFTDDSAFTLRMNLHNADVTTLQALAGYRYNISGTADLFLQAAGTRRDPHGSGRVHLTGASVYGEPVQQFDANLQLANGEITFDQIHLFHDDSVVTGSAAYNPTTREFHVDLAGNNLDVARIRQIHTGRIPLAGRADFTLKGSGTPEAPSINAGIHVRNLAVDREVAGELDLQAVTQGQALHVTGNSSFQHGSLLIDGTVQLKDEYPANFSAQMKDLDLDAIWREYVGGQLTGHSAVAGTIEMRGPLREPSRWVVGGNLTEVSLEVESVKLHNQEPIRFSLGDQVARIEQLHLVGEGTDLTAHGSVQLTGSRELDLAADGHLDLKLLSTIDPDYSGSGTMTLNVTVGGTVDEPFPRGHMQLTDGAISYAGLPSGLSEMKGSLVFTRDRVHIENLTARTGGGSIDLKGDASYFNKQLNFDLTATGKDVRLRYPPGVSSTANAELHWVGTGSSSTVSGDILVTKLAVTPGFDFSSYLERSRQVTAVTTANSPLYNVKLDIHVQTAPELQMKTAVARLSGDADLRLRGSVARPAVLGRADILEGQATFHGTRYTLERGDITFTSPIGIEPQLNLQASTHVRNYDLSITVTGKPDQPGGLRVNYRSEPPLPQSEIIALLALGRTSEESEQLQQQTGQNAFTDEASALILNEALNATVTSRLQRLFGAGNIKIDPQGRTTETNPTARGPQVTIEQEFANNLSLTYSTNVSQSSQQIIQGEYYFNRNLSVVGTRDQNGVVSFDVRIRRRKK